MTNTMSSFNSGSKEERWFSMITLSFLFHFMIFSSILFVPQTKIRFPSMDEKIYHVELVGFPSSGKAESKGRDAVVAGKTKKTSNVLKAETRLIAPKEKNPVSVVAKRVSTKPIAPKREKEIVPSKLIDSAVSKIEKEVEKEMADRSEKIADESTQGAGDGGTFFERFSGAGTGILSGVGKVMQLYQMEIENTIKNNWSFPVALLDSKMDKSPEAIIVVEVRSDGKIQKAWFRKKSSNSLFDDSVLKAVEKSDPLPAFPPGYKKRYEDVEINFSLKDLIQ
ncbi:MAG TPA: TonB family protein [Desulfatiglandales bacterium]|nr:TonB family protein [Desulfatiglandales bacterium]